MIVPSNCATAEQPVCITAAEGEEAILQVSRGVALDVRGSHIRIDGLHFKTLGILLRDVEDIAITNCLFTEVT